MLNDAVCFKQVYIVTSYNDLRSEIDRLAALITSKTGDNPFVPDTLYLFCGRGCGRFLGPELSNSKTASILHRTQTP